MNTFLRVTICSVSGCIGRIGEEFIMSSAVLIYMCLVLIAAAASEPEANERGSSLISGRLHYRGLQSLFLTKRKEL